MVNITFTLVKGQSSGVRVNVAPKAQATGSLSGTVSCKTGSGGSFTATSNTVTLYSSRGQFSVTLTKT